MIENLFIKIRTQNFPNLGRRNVMKVQEAQRTPIKVNPKGPTPTHIIVKMLSAKDKERNLKAAREKLIVSKELQ